jgi:hypothetical protein
MAKSRNILEKQISLPCGAIVSDELMDGFESVSRILQSDFIAQCFQQIMFH